MSKTEPTGKTVGSADCPPLLAGWAGRTSIVTLFAPEAGRSETSSQTHNLAPSGTSE